MESINQDWYAYEGVTRKLKRPPVVVETKEDLNSDLILVDFIRRAEALEDDRKHILNLIPLLLTYCSTDPQLKVVSNTLSELKNSLQNPILKSILPHATERLENLKNEVYLKSWVEYYKGANHV